jgi:hypothetical protein
MSRHIVNFVAINTQPNLMSYHMCKLILDHSLAFHAKIVARNSNNNISVGNTVSLTPVTQKR